MLGRFRPHDGEDLRKDASICEHCNDSPTPTSTSSSSSSSSLESMPPNVSKDDLLFASPSRRQANTAIQTRRKSATTISNAIPELPKTAFHASKMSPMCMCVCVLVACWWPVYIHLQEKEEQKTRITIGSTRTLTSRISSDTLTIPLR